MEKIGCFVFTVCLSVLGAGLAGFFVLWFALVDLIDLGGPDRILTNAEKNSAALTFSGKCMLVAFAFVAILGFINSNILNDLGIAGKAKRNWLMGLGILPVLACGFVLLIGLLSIYR